jgi:4-cresol dehydrogenase (hydroxylating) flavoprotein subunit
MTDVVAQPDAHRDISRALDEFAALLGPEAVLTADADLREFRDPYSFVGWEEHTASAIVSPTTVEQVQAIVRIADEHGVPLWTFSQGRNNGYGGPAPRVRGSVLVNLRGMNRVLEVDEDLGFALVEPGVRFFDLYEHLGRTVDHRLWLSIPDLGWGSVIGNTLDHGFGFNPLGDHPGRQCGMEVVLASGDVLRTGMGAMEGNTAWQTAKRGFGPSVDSLFMQSNFGIVTKMGVWLMPAPECYMSCDVQVPHEADLGALVETVRPLLLDRTIDNFPIAYNATLVTGAFGHARRDDWYDGDGPLPSEILKRMADAAGVGWWTMRFALYGIEEIVDAKLRICQRAIGRIRGAKLAARKYDGRRVGETFAEPATGIEPGLAGALGRLRDQSDRCQACVPGLELLDNLSWDEQGAGGHLDFSPVASLTGAEALRQNDLLRDMLGRRGFDYAASLMLTPRSFVNITSVWFDTRDEARTRRAYDVCREVAEEAGRHGYGAYRAHLSLMDTVAEQYGFNDHAYRRFNETLKDALDPNGILAPGKQGIWPRALRGNGNTNRHGLVNKEEGR